MVENTQLPTNTEINPRDLPKDMPGVASKGGRGFKKFLFVILAFTVVVVAVALFLNLSSSKNAKVLETVKQADQALSEGKYDEAARKYKEVLVERNNSTYALSGLIKTIASKGNESGTERTSFEEAKPYIDQAVKVGSNHVLVLLSVGYAYETAGDYQKAFELYDKATKIDPNLDEAWFHRGHALEFLDRAIEAYASYDNAFSLNPNNPLVLMTRGNRFLNEGNPADAFKAFMFASENEAVNTQIRSEALVAASKVSLAEFDLKGSLELAKKAIELSPNLSPALGQYGYLLALNGSRAEGAGYLKRAIEANPRISIHYVNLAQVLRADKNFNDAINYNKQALSVLNQDNTILSEAKKISASGVYTYELAKTYDMAKFSSEVVRLLKDAIRLNPGINRMLQDDYSNNKFFRQFENDTEFRGLISS